MKKIASVLILCFAATGLLATDHKDKSCDMAGKNAKTISLTGKVACKSDDDCTFQTADAKSTYTVCEMSKADLPKLSTAGQTISVKGKLITCEGKEKLLIQKVGE